MNGLGYDTTVMVRSIVLRGFDQQIVNMVAEEMKNRGVHFIHQAKPKKIDKQANGRLLVHWVDNVCLDNYITVYKDIKSLIN